MEGVKEIRAKPEIDLVSIQCYLSRHKLQDGLNLDPDAHFQAGVLGCQPLSEVLAHIPVLFPV